MPSPFPGMDPYLEHPEVFPELQFSMIMLLKENLQGRLPEPFYATSNSRAWIEYSEVSRVPHDECREVFLDICRLQDDAERVVTTIEVLSPVDKKPGEHGRELFLRKQRQVLDSKVHLVEIDLLRGGIHSTAVLRERAEEESVAFDYHVCVHFFDHFEDYLVYPIRLEERLPEIAIPLLPKDSPVLIDLQAIFDRAYDIGLYRRRIRYDQETPVPPLSAEQAEWATRLLREKGLLASA